LDKAAVQYAVSVSFHIAQGPDVTSSGFLCAEERRRFKLNDQIYSESLLEPQQRWNEKWQKCEDQEDKRKTSAFVSWVCTHR
jgi:hypothetical protein